MLEKTELNREMVDTAVEAQAHGAEAGSPDWQERQIIWRILFIMEMSVT